MIHKCSKCKRGVETRWVHITIQNDQDKPGHGFNLQTTTKNNNELMCLIQNAVEVVF